MDVQTTPHGAYQPVLPFAPGFGGSPVAECREPGSAFGAKVPRMIRSVVEEAGLGGFVYLKGVSGKRYVFSSISPEQASLYDKALFAVTNSQGELMRIGEIFSELKSHGSVVYVHLLDQEKSDNGETLGDLHGSH